MLLDGILTVSISRFAYAIRSPERPPSSSYAHFEKVFALNQQLRKRKAAPACFSLSGSICIDLQRPEGVLRDRIEFAILFRFDPTYLVNSWRRLAKRPLRLPTCASSERRDIRVRVYFIYGFAIHQMMKTGNTVGRPCGIAVPLTGRRGETRGAQRSVSVARRYTGAMGAAPHSKRRK